MSERIEGRYFDGVDGREHAVALRRVGMDHYAIEGDGVTRGGSLARLSITPRLARIARTIEFGDGARLLVAHDAHIDTWFPRQSRIEAIVDRLEHHAHAVAAAIVISIATLAFGTIWGVPWLADRIVEQIPPSTERTLGEHVMGQLDRLGFKPSALDSDRREALAARFVALTRGLDGASGYRLEFRNAPGIGANAFALPGSHIVVTDELIGLLGDDREFDAVVAHEVGHQQRRHALRQTLRGSFVAIAGALFAGDASAASSVVVAVPTFLLGNHYSRAFEEEADRFAFDLLSSHAESPHWFADAMRTLQIESPHDGQLAYLSSHPPTSARIAAADSAAVEFANAHPDLCPNGQCDGEGDDEEDAYDDEDDAADTDEGDGD